MKRSHTYKKRSTPATNLLTLASVATACLLLNVGLGRADDDRMPDTNLIQTLAGPLESGDNAQEPIVPSSQPTNSQFGPARAQDSAVKAPAAAAETRMAEPTAQPVEAASQMADEHSALWDQAGAAALESQPPNAGAEPVAGMLPEPDHTGMTLPGAALSGAAGAQLAQAVSPAAVLELANSLVALKERKLAAKITSISPAITQILEKARVEERGTGKLEFVREMRRKVEVVHYSKKEGRLIIRDSEAFGRANDWVKSQFVVELNRMAKHQNGEKLSLLERLPLLHTAWVFAKTQTLMRINQFKEAREARKMEARQPRAERELRAPAGGRFARAM